LGTSESRNEEWNVVVQHIHGDSKHETHTYLMKRKSETLEKYKAFKAWVWTQYGKKIKIFQVDNGGEFISNEFKEHLQKQGTELRLTVHHSPQQNGVAERLNYTLVEHAHAMLIASGLPRSLWGAAVMHATCLKIELQPAHYQIKLHSKQQTTT
jgi:hypothetical protein